MTLSDPAAPPSATPGRDRFDPRIRPLRAARAFRRLLQDNEDTPQVFEIMKALNGRSTARGYLRLLRSQTGGAIACRQVELAGCLDACAARGGYAPGTVGDRYVRFVRGAGFTAHSLAQASEQPRDLMIAMAHPYAWFGRRVRDVHDVWHVLTGYGREALGELCLTAFSYAQTGQGGWGFIAAAGALQALRGPRGPAAVGAILEAWRNGRRAAWLLGEDYPPLLDEPLAEARNRLSIMPTPRYDALGTGLRANVIALRPCRTQTPGGRPQSLARSE